MCITLRHPIHSLGVSRFQVDRRCNVYPGIGKSEDREAMYFCYGCKKRGYRDAFDRGAAALDARLGLPMFDAHGERKVDESNWRTYD